MILVFKALFEGIPRQYVSCLTKLSTNILIVYFNIQVNFFIDTEGNLTVCEFENRHQYVTCMITKILVMIVSKSISI